MGAPGPIGPPLPEEQGGLGQTALTVGIIAEAIASDDFNVSHVQLLASLIGRMPARRAAPGIAAERIPKIACRQSVAGLGLT